MIWEFGLVTEPFDAVVAGKKTIEGRLNKGKFAQFKVGDIVTIRKDYRDEHGVIQDGKPNAARVKIMAIRTYANFADMVESEGVGPVASTTTSAEETVSEYNVIYAQKDQATYGVLAIEVRLLHS